MKRYLQLLLLSSALATTATADMFELRIDNLGPQPLSPVFYAAGNLNFNAFSIGSAASVGIKDIAETGNATAMLGIAGSAGSDVVDFGTTSGGPIMPGQFRTATFNADPSHGYFSFASMLGLTNDGFIGESVNSMVLNLYSGSTPTGFTYTVFGSRAWDAGTELNTQDSADLAALGGSGNPGELPGMSHVRMHGGIVAGIGDSWDQLPNWNTATPLARLEVTPTPEPATFLALTLGVAAIWSRKRKKSE